MTDDPQVIIEQIEQRLGLYKLLFAQQRKFILDPAKRKAALCSRRAGKSYAIAVALASIALKHSGNTSVYIALTRSSAKRIIWPILRTLDTDHSLGLQFNHTELTVAFPNGSQIWLTGADDQAQIEKLRGSAYRLVVIDEAASFGAHLAELVDEVLEPALLDYDGSLCLIGTPGAACVGKFHDITTLASSTWNVHRWTVLDNPFIPRARQWLANRCHENGWTQDHPIYRREWLGEWVWDATSMVYRFKQENICESLPEREWINTLGVDLGFDDDTAFQVVSSHPDVAQCYVHSGWKSPGMNVTQVSEKIREYMTRMSVNRIVMDTGGIGKMVAEELKVRHGLPILAAEKTDKLGAVELLNGDLHSNRVKILRDEPVLKEWQVLQWDETRKKEDERYPNHLSDATLYAYRAAIHWAHRPSPSLPKPGTDEFTRWEEDKLEEENSVEEEKDDILNGFY